MKLLYYELKKMLGLRLLWMLLVLCLIANGVLVYSFTEKDEAYPHLKKVEAAHLEDPNGLYRYYEQLTVQSNEYRLLMEAYFRGELAEEPTLERPCTFSGDTTLDDELLIRTFYRKANSERFFKADLERVIRQAKAQQAETLFSHALFGEDGFAYQQQGLIVQTYTDIYLNAEIQPEIAYGWDQLFAFDTVNLFLLLLVMSGTVAVLYADVEGTALILRSTPNGRRLTAAAKFSALLLFSLLTTLLLLFSTYLGVWLKCGTLSSLSNSIAIFADYGMVPLCVTVGEYLCLFTLSKLLLCTAAAMLCALLCLALRSLLAGCAAMLGAVAVSALLYGLLPLDGGKFMNLFGVARFVSLTESFYCVNLFGYAVLLLPVALILTALIGVLCGIRSLLLYCRSGRMPSASKRLSSLLRRLQLRLYKSKKARPENMKGTSLSLLFYELRKTFLTRGGLLLLLTVLLLKIGIVNSTYTRQVDYQATLYKDYVTPLIGPVTEEKQQQIEAEYARVQTAIDSFDRMRYAFLRGELDGESYAAFLKEYNDAADRAEPIAQLRAHADYLDNVSKKHGTSGYFLYNLDWDRLFSAGADVLLILFCILLFSGVFADEYSKSGIIQMLRTTPKGRQRLFGQKLLFTLLASGALTLLFGGVDAVMLLSRFDLHTTEAPLLSLECFGNVEASISIGDFLLLGAAVRIFAVMLIALLSCLLGALLKHRLFAQLSTLAICFLPRVAASFGLQPLRYADLIGATHLPDLLLVGGGWSFVWLFLICFALLLLALTLFARKEFCQ
ncbi:MAG: hypothetical protein IJY22_00250 [Clostridia bacterium]|nr:hypothetical protein [Clostridia bacterium]